MSKFSYSSILIALVIVLTGCEQEQIENPGLEVQSNEHLSEMVQLTLTSRTTNKPLYELLVGRSYLRPDWGRHPEVAKNHVISSAAHFYGVLQDGEIRAGSEIDGVDAKRFVRISLNGVPDGQEHRTRTMWDNNYDKTNHRVRTGEYRFGLEEISTEEDPNKSYVLIGEQDPFGFVFIKCNGAQQSNGTHILEDGFCHVDNEMRPNIIITASFSYAQLSEWKNTLMVSQKTVNRWIQD